ncbi:MAG: SPOR domain-containing protein [Alphaproteobacteria bacterium]|nr:SPOR domain-containing protein [Alphaproteobacteria bacterium]
MSDKPNRERMEPELGQDLLDILPDRAIGGMGGAALPPRPLPRKKRQGFLLWFLLFFLASGAAVATWWWAVSGSKSTGSEAEVPLVKADQRSYKSKPTTPGGMEVPDQDKMVYNRLSASEEANRQPVERLLPPPEIPQAPPMPSPLAAAPVAPVVPVTPVPSAPPPIIPDLPQVSQKETPRAQPPSMGAAAPPEPAPLEPPPLAKPPAPAKPAAKSSDVTVKIADVPKASAGGAWLVQLVAITDEAATSREWGRIQKANSDLLGALSLDVQKADLGAKGIFYRLRAGSLESKEAAQQLCSQLAARKQGCIVVRR